MLRKTLPFVLLLAALPLRAEIHVNFERIKAPGESKFAFKTIPAPSRDDLGTIANLTLLGGKVDRSSAELDTLIDGNMPMIDDEPGANLFFAANTWGGRVRFDLGASNPITRISSYSWHPGSRGPQVYKLYGSDGTERGLDLAPTTQHDPETVGWKLIAFVDTRGNVDDEGGQYGVSITDTSGSLGRYRYLLFDAFETESDDPWGNTFYSEIDVHGGNRGGAIAYRESATSGTPRRPEAREPAGVTPALRKELAEKVRSEFLYSWNAYQKYAANHDELKPLSKAAKDWHEETLLMTPVDTLDTLILLGFKEEAEKTQKQIVETLTFDKDITVKNFEITIRILGGLLSAHQLTGDERLLSLADDLGQRLLPVFESPTGMPYMYINLKTGKVSGAKSNPAEIGTLMLEFGTLAKLTKKPVYYDKAKRAVVEMYKLRSKLGLVGEEINVETGVWASTQSHVGGGIDSYYEYLLKSWLLFDDRDFLEMWQVSSKALNKHLADKAPSGLWYGQVDMHSGKRTAAEYGALHAFLPSVLALGGDVKRAKQLQDSCFKMWNRHGIEPEVINYQTMEVAHAGYPLRPEIMESAYYLHHYTRDPKYLQMGRVFFEGLMQHCRTEAGYTTLKSVVTKEKGDLMPSYFLAETLKYLYLLFADDEKLKLGDVVFNTEAHPLRRTW